MQSDSVVGWPGAKNWVRHGELDGRFIGSYRLVDLTESA